MTSSIRDQSRSRLTQVQEAADLKSSGSQRDFPRLLLNFQLHNLKITSLYRSAGGSVLNFQLHNLKITSLYRSAGSSVFKDIAIDVGGPEINSWTGHIGHSFADGSPPLRCFIGAVSPRF